jgi:hypothetical protein
MTITTQSPVGEGQGGGGAISAMPEGNTKILNGIDLFFFLLSFYNEIVEKKIRQPLYFLGKNTVFLRRKEFRY